MDVWSYIKQFLQRYMGSVWSMIFLAMLLAVCMLSFQYMLARFLYTEIEEKLNDVTDKSAILVESRIEDAYAHLNSAGILIGGDGNADLDGLRNLRQQAPALNRFALFGAISVEGKLLYGMEMPMNRSLLLPTFRGHNQILCMEAGRLLSGQQAMLLSVPIWHDGKVAGAVYGVLGGREMDALFAGVVFAEQGSTFCASRDFRTIGCASGTTSECAAISFFAGGDRKILENLYRKLYYKQHGVEQFTYNGTEYYISSVALKELDGWYINGVIPAERAGMSLRRLLLVASMAYLALALLFLAAVWIIGSNARKNQEKILKLAYEDELTGLPNWAKMQRDWAKKTVQEGWQLAILDFDDFSLMNTIMGREYCDYLLQQTGVLLRVFQRKGELVCRVRSDRFALCLFGEDVQQRLEQLIENVQHRSKRYPAALACGISSIAAGRKITEIYEDALTALKHVKACRESGIIVYDQQMSKERRQNKRLAAEFDRALCQGELRLFLQAKHYLQQDGWSGSEALVRWQHPELGLLFPGRFIPILEKNGDINKLDLYILREVCRVIRHWLDEGRVVYPVSVNLSRTHFANPDLVEHIQAVIREFAIPLDYIELEITESAFFRDGEFMMEKLHELHEAGFSLSIDDFGTGYSSLSMLERMPTDVLKLDKSFVDNWLAHPGSCLIKDIVQMARHFGMTVVIEGVETAEQVEMARRSGCDIAQGYHYARPVPVADYESLVYGGEADEKHSY